VKAGLYNPEFVRAESPLLRINTRTFCGTI